MMIARFYKMMGEPLIQFVAIAVVISVFTEVFAPQGNTETSYDIDVNETTLIKFMQFQNKRFDSPAADAEWLAMSAEYRELLIADYVRDEVLFREALALGLEVDDQIIRRRLTQKLDYVTRGFIEDNGKISSSELENYFSENRESYLIDASITYTHVFFNIKNRGPDGSETAASSTLAHLNSKNIPFEQAATFGDRFLFHRNYVDRTPDFVKSHFGEAFSREVFKLKPSLREWQGPFTSRYGTHLVQVTKNLPSRIPELEEVAAMVLDDLRRLKVDGARKAAVDKMISKYSISRNLSLDSTPRALAYVP